MERNMMPDRKGLTVQDRPDIEAVVVRYDGGQFMISKRDAEFVAMGLVDLLPDSQRAFIATAIIASLIRDPEEQEKYFSIMQEDDDPAPLVAN